MIDIPAEAHATPASDITRPLHPTGAGGGGAPGALISPIQGTVLKVAVEQGATVEEGALVCVIEAMKMENEITATVAGKVQELNVKEGASVSAGDALATIA
jgi:acetyl-CoA/propionyl-CoA carboxylase biotin carboxyl carrier protein